MSKFAYGEAEKIAGAFAEDYDFTDGEGSYHTPTEGERVMLVDMVHGLFADTDFIAALDKAIEMKNRINEDDLTDHQKKVLDLALKSGFLPINSKNDIAWMTRNAPRDFVDLYRLITEKKPMVGVPSPPLEPDPEFDAWVDSLPKNSWVHYDLSAARLGWEARKTQERSDRFTWKAGEVQIVHSDDVADLGGGASFSLEPGPNPLAWVVMHGEQKVAIAYDWKPEYESGLFHTEPLFSGEQIEAVRRELADALQERNELRALVAVPPRKPNIDRMVERFLRWKIPDTFSPDCFVNFSRAQAYQHGLWPVGTNIFTADEARQLFEHALREE